jgi:nuclear GTP-binding protein
LERAPPDTVQNPEWRTRLKKDPGIPNLFPYKEKLLHEIEEKKRLKEEAAARRKEDAKAKDEPEFEAETMDTMQRDTELLDQDLSVDEDMDVSTIIDKLGMSDRLGW